MARSNYIYVVVDNSGPENKTITAFTVKHECITWINRQFERHKDERDVFCRLEDLVIERFPDGGRGQKERMSALKFMA